MNHIKSCDSSKCNTRVLSTKRVLILHQGDESLATDNPMIQHAAMTSEDIAGSLERRGKRVTRVLLQPEALQFAQAIVKAQPDIVFNLCDLGAFYCERLEPHVVAALELLRVDYTGSDALTLSLTDDKVLCKRLLTSYGIPTPPFALASAKRPEVLHDVGLPAICKPIDQHNSVGVDFDSVVYSSQALQARLDSVGAENSHWLLERYIEGREIIGAFLGNGPDRVVLPFEEIVFGQHFEGKPKVLTWDSKWAEESDACKDSRPVIPADLDQGLQRRLTEALLAVADAFRIREYGRVDFRVDRDGGVWVIDVNANPDVGRDAGLFKMANYAGYSYEDFVEAIVDAALVRYGHSA